MIISTISMIGDLKQCKNGTRIDGGRNEKLNATAHKPQINHAVAVKMGAMYQGELEQRWGVLLLAFGFFDSLVYGCETLQQLLFEWYCQSAESPHG